MRLGTTINVRYTSETQYLVCPRVVIDEDMKGCATLAIA